ncbi:hypothetical protein C8Q74DRAFT_352923 [Fomes fomentarius]|nr:hypothetical protein C8Q74DRAFT_352923 [Fomes fomentarius]
MRTLQHLTLAMPDDVPFYENEDVLVRIRHAALYDYNNTTDLKDQFVKCSTHLTRYPFVSLLPGMDAGDGEKVLDIGLRYYSGCSVREPNIDRALFIWEMITDANHESAVPKVSRSLLARAYSCLAYAYFELHHRACTGDAVERDPTLSSRHLLPTRTPDDNLSNDLLYIGAIYADASAELGLISPTVLHTASYILHLGKRDGVDLKRSARYGPLKHLWRAEEARTKEWAEEQRKKAAKVARAPNAYVCATPGCEIAANQKKALMRCAGRCPMERKPHYCSKECQRKDWRAHKPFCKLDAELTADGPPPPPVDGAPRLTADSDLSNTIEREPEIPDPGFEGPEHAIEIDVPGQGMVRVESRNLTPAVLRWIRDKAGTERPRQTGVRRGAMK